MFGDGIYLIKKANNVEDIQELWKQGAAEPRKRHTLEGGCSTNHNNQPAAAGLGLLAIVPAKHRGIHPSPRLFRLLFDFA
jgi:hypothetical protein